MPDESSGLRYYVDESLLGLGKILERARRDLVYPGHRDFPEVETGSLDVEWMPKVAGLGLVVFIRDKRIRTKAVELATFYAFGLRVFGITDKRDLTNWGYLYRVVRHWERIEAVIKVRGPGPWFYAITESGLADVPLKSLPTVNAV